ARKRGKRSVLFDLGDRQPPVPTLAAIGAGLGMDLPGPACPVLPALAAVLGGGKDAWRRHAGSLACHAQVAASSASCTAGGYIPVSASCRSSRGSCPAADHASLHGHGSRLCRAHLLRSRLGRRLARRRAAERDAVAVLLDRAQPDALDQRQLLGALEAAVGLAVGDDGLGLLAADVDERGVDLGGVGAVDVHLVGGLGPGRGTQPEGQQQAERQQADGIGEMLHGESPWMMCGFRSLAVAAARWSQSLHGHGGNVSPVMPGGSRGTPRLRVGKVLHRGRSRMGRRRIPRSPMPTPSAALDSAAIDRFVSRMWDEDIVPQLVEYIRIPNKSPMFDADWVANGHMERAVALMEAWARAQPIDGLVVEVIRLEGRTPLIYLEVPASGPDTGEDCVLLYGHLDKQPEMTGWDEDLGPWKPVLKGDRLYGRGGADDGYAIFGSLAALEALQAQGAPHARCVILIEACEESGSYDLPAYVDHLAPRIGQPSLVVCLDSGCGNYEQLWCTTSLRGLAGGNLAVKVLDEGVHSGDASGIVPSSFRLLRQLLSRIEDEETGRILLDGLHADIPQERIAQAARVAEVLGTEVYDKFPLVDGLRPMDDDLAELVLNRTWRPALSLTGMDGIPPLASAGNVLRPATAVKLSLRLPPTIDGRRAGELLKEALLRDPPNGAQVTLELEKASSGWNAPALAPWLEQAIDTASNEFFGKPAMYMGEGGSIPFMGMLGE